MNEQVEEIKTEIKRSRVMRQIKFRGKEVDGGRWISGSLLVWPDGETYILYDRNFATSGTVSKESVRPETVGQYIERKVDILPRLKPWNSWVLTPPHGRHSGFPRLTGTPQRGNALPQNVVRSMKVAVVMGATNRTGPLPVMQR